MLISWDRDMLLISWATRWDIGAVEVTQGQELLVAARAAPVFPVAAAAGTAISPDSATATAAVTNCRWLCLPQAGRMRLISRPIIAIASNARRIPRTYT